MSVLAESLYTNTLIAGPMVRGSSHIFRLSCLHYGADVVFSPGLVDLAIINSTRQIEDGHVVLATDSNGHKSTLFETCEAEKGRLVLQIVTHDSCQAVKAAQVLADDIAAIDINCGCPEKFACHNGGGSSIELETAVDVVKTLVRDINKPVSVKFRVFSESEKSIQFAQAVESAGASAITVHGRLKEQKHQGHVDYEQMKVVFDSVKCFKVGNGGINSRAEAEKMKAETGCQSVMISGAAMHNPSVFANDGEIRGEIEVLAEMAKIGRAHNLAFRHCKWSIQQVYQTQKSLTKKIGQEVAQAQTWDEFDEIVRKNI